MAERKGGSPNQTDKDITPKDAGPSLGRRFASGITDAGLVVWLAGTEFRDTVRDNMAALVAMRFYTPVESRLIKGGLGVEVLLPVTQVGGQEWPGFMQRVSESVKNRRSGKMEPHLRRSPRGKEEGRDLTTPVAGSFRAQRIGGMIAGGAQFARMTLTPDLTEVARSMRRSKRLAEGEKRDSRLSDEKLLDRVLRRVLRRADESHVLPDPSDILLPRLDLGFQVAWFDRAHGGKLVSQQITFPIGYDPIRFDAEGKLAASHYTVDGITYQPSLLGLTDFARVLSEGIRLTAGGKLATVNPLYIEMGLEQGAYADTPLRPFIEPHYDRLETTDTLNRFLAQRPGVMVSAVNNTVHIVDNKRNPHPDKVAIMSEFHQCVMALGGKKDGNHGLWGEFIAAFTQACDKRKALTIWGGSHTSPGLILDYLSQPHEVREFFEGLEPDRMNELKELLDRGLRPVPEPAGSLLSGFDAPVNLVTDIKTQAVRAAVNRQAGRETNRRAIATGRAIIDIMGKTTVKKGEKLRAELENFLADPEPPQTPQLPEA